jgi:hypothetical protein
MISHSHGIVETLNYLDADCGLRKKQSSTEKNATSDGNKLFPHPSGPISTSFDLISHLVHLKSYPLPASLISRLHVIKDTTGEEAMPVDQQP